MKREFTGAEIDVLVKLYRFGPQEDGDIPSKAGRNSLCARGLVTHDRHGMNSLTTVGAEWARRVNLWTRTGKP